MICVLQIGGYELEKGIAGLLAIPFYRKEHRSDGYEVIYYDVADVLDRQEFVNTVRRFIEENKAAFAYAAENPQRVQMVNFDVGLIVAETLSLSVHFQKEAVEDLAEIGASLTISAYKATS